MVSTPATPNANRPKKMFRFALYGPAVAGKTCILAALAMPRLPHPKNLTRTWMRVPEGLARPPGDPAGWDPKDRGAAFHLGVEWLDQARAQLTRGEAPEANPNREPYHFLYDFTAPDAGPMQVELIDYSGELLDEDVGELASRLRQRLRTMDAIFVLAEMPHHGDEGSRLTEQLYRLERAFVRLREGMQNAENVPLALLINKWDRCCRLEDYHPDRAAEQVRTFLESPSHRHGALAAVLANTVGKQNFQPFAISAFGIHEVVRRPDGSQEERPKLVKGQLCSFGLEDAFVWAAQRRNAIDLEEYREHASGVRGALWPWGKGRQGRELSRRFPRGSENYSTAKRLARVCSLVAWSYLVTAGLLAAALVGLGTEAVSDYLGHKTSLTAYYQPGTADEQRRAREWLEEYAEAPWYRHLLYSRGWSAAAARQTLARLDAEEEQAWQDVEARRPDRKAQLAPARTYRERWKIGRHLDSVATIIREGEEQSARAEKVQEVRQKLQQLEDELGALQARKEKDEGEYRKLQQRFEQLPRLAAGEPDELFARRLAVQERLARASIDLGKATREERERTEWLAFREKHGMLLGAGKVVEAAQHLHGAPPRGQGLAELKKDFEDKALAVLKERQRVHLAERRWPQAREEVKKVQQSVEVQALLPVEQWKFGLEKLLQEAEDAEDRDLYGDVRTYKTRDYARRYLDFAVRAARPKMRDAVKKYDDFLARLDGPLDLTLKLKRIDWTGKCYDRYNTASVVVDGETIIQNTKVESVPGQSSEEVDSGKLTQRRLSETVSVKVEVQYNTNYNLLGKGNGQGETTVQLQKFLEKPSLEVELKYYDPPSKATLVLELPADAHAPELPAWGE